MASTEPPRGKRRQPHVLSIAGSDSGGGAGIQADLKTIAAFGCYGSTVITALTAQNTLGVQAVHEVPADFVIKQLDSIFSDDLVPDAIKFGMLSTEPIISALAAFFASLLSASSSSATPSPSPAARPYLILDPVMISTSGHTLLPPSAVDALRTRLLPLVDLATPNIPEAVALAGWADTPVRGVADMVALARAVRDQCGVRAVLVKGGHMPLPQREVEQAVSATVSETWTVHGSGRHGNDEQVVVDVLVRHDGVALFIGSMVESTSTHGTGCTLSAALASCYALGAAEGRTALSDDAVSRAIEYTQGAIAAAFPLGRGHGPLNHGHMTVMRERVAR